MELWLSSAETEALALLSCLLSPLVSQVFLPTISSVLSYCSIAWWQVQKTEFRTENSGVRLSGFLLWLFLCIGKMSLFLCDPRFPIYKIMWN
jgi:hypothetical protein